MRTTEQVKRDARNGLAVSRTFAASKGLESSLISRAIARAMRRGRITQETARRCTLNWVHDRNARPKAQVWGRVAARELLEAATLRRRGLYSHARYTLSTVRLANQRAKLIDC